jgi:hypothetical protein
MVDRCGDGMSRCSGVEISGLAVPRGLKPFDFVRFMYELKLVPFKADERPMKGLKLVSFKAEKRLM